MFVRACVRACLCVRACVRACVRVCACFACCACVRVGVRLRWSSARARRGDIVGIRLYCCLFATFSLAALRACRSLHGASFSGCSPTMSSLCRLRELRELHAVAVPRRPGSTRLPVVPEQCAPTALHANRGQVQLADGDRGMPPVGQSTDIHIHRRTTKQPMTPPPTTTTTGHYDAE